MSEDQEEKPKSDPREIPPVLDIIQISTEAVDKYIKAYGHRFDTQFMAFTIAETVIGALLLDRKVIMQTMKKVFNNPMVNNKGPHALHNFVKGMDHFLMGQADIYGKQFDALSYTLFPENKIEVPQ
jgi:hypothetical protein